MIFKLLAEVARETATASYAGACFYFIFLCISWNTSPIVIDVDDKYAVFSAKSKTSSA